MAILGQRLLKSSARSDGEINVQFLLEKIGGGGHQASAAAVLKDKTLSEVAELLTETIALNLNKARVAGGKKGRII